MFTQNQPSHTEAALSASSSRTGSNRELSDLLSNHLFSIVTVYLLNMVLCFLRSKSDNMVAFPSFIVQQTNTQQAFGSFPVNITA